MITGPLSPIASQNSKTGTPTPAPTPPEVKIHAPTISSTPPTQVGIKPLPISQQSPKQLINAVSEQAAKTLPRDLKDRARLAFIRENSGWVITEWRLDSRIVEGSQQRWTLGSDKQLKSDVPFAWPKSVDSTRFEALSEDDLKDIIQKELNQKNESLKSWAPFSESWHLEGRQSLIPTYQIDVTVADAKGTPFNEVWFINGASKLVYMRGPQSRHGGAKTMGLKLKGDQ